MPFTGLYATTVSRFSLYTLLLVLLLAGCSSTPTRQVAAPDRLQQQAAALEARGYYAGAAQLYLDVAAKKSGAQQQALQLLASESLLRGDDFLAATQLLNSLPAQLANNKLQQQATVNRAAIATGEQRPADALQLLRAIATSSPYAARAHRLRAEAYLLDYRYFQSARERILLDPLLVSADARLDNQNDTWTTLNRLSNTELQQLRSAPPPDPLSGWIELVELSRLYLQQPDALTEVIPHWQQRYPGHPASAAFIPELLKGMHFAGQPPTQIALLLPLTGKLADATAAIRDGVLAAYYDTPDSGIQPQLQLYDTGNSADTALAAYQQAVLDGAEFVIGPLRKEAVQLLAQQAQLTIPVLALNQFEDASLYNPMLYQFGLAPEDEAREVARLAWREGHRRSLALMPENAWGERVYTAFAEEWALLGGNVVDSIRYDDSKADHGKAISQSLNLDSSNNRQQRLTQLLGLPLEFEPRRRKDVDFFFLVASPRQARLIRPQLSFYRASAVPVYATSRVYSGKPNAAQDSDMNGIVFCDMPWTLDKDGSWSHLQQGIANAWPAAAQRYARLYALGIDAYRIMPFLGAASGINTTSMLSAYRGVTGNLSMIADGQITRTLRCAEFKRGVPVMMEQAVLRSADTADYPSASDYPSTPDY